MKISNLAGVAVALAGLSKNPPRLSAVLCASTARWRREEIRKTAEAEKD
jgi:hypothetical protein